MTSGRIYDMAEALRSAAVGAAGGRPTSSEGSAVETGRRIRAALALAGLSATDVAPELNISARTLDRTMAGERHARDWELRRLAELLPVPEWFLFRGFSAPTEAAPAQPELVALDRRLDVDIIPRLDSMASELRAIARSVAEGTRA